MYDRLARIGGAALVVGSAALVVITLVLQVGNGEQDHTNPMNIAAQWASMPISLLVVFGLPALTARLARRAPVLALLGSAGVALGLLVYGFAIALIDAAVLPWLLAHHVHVGQPASMLVALLGGGLGVIVGSVLLGVAVLRSSGFPRAAGALLIAAGILYAASIAPITGWVGTIGVVALLAGLGICGVQLVRTGDVNVSTSVPAQMQPEA